MFGNRINSTATVTLKHISNIQLLFLCLLMPGAWLAPCKASFYPIPSGVSPIQHSVKWHWDWCEVWLSIPLSRTKYRPIHGLYASSALLTSKKQRGWTLTFGLALGFSCSNFFAAASIDAAAPSSSVSAMTVGSSGSTHSVPEINGDEDNNFSDTRAAIQTWWFTITLQVSNRECTL